MRIHSAMFVALLLPLSFGAQAARGAVGAIANCSATAQAMDNFSASDAWCMQNIGTWPSTDLNLVADLLFTTNSGIGLSAWRFNLGAGIDPAITDPWRTTDSFLVSSNNY